MKTEKMFVKKSWNTKGKKRYFCYEIAESYRPGKGKYPRTRTLANITHLPKPLIDKIALLLKFPTASVISNLSSFFKNSFVFGPIVFLYLFMKKLKIIDCLKIIPVKSRVLLIAVILNRILEPRSKLAGVSWVKRTAFPLLFGIDKNKLVVNQVYKAMDILYQRMDEVLDNFFQTNKKQTILLLYDITSVFFEGAGPEELAKYGYSRDKRANNPQILLCLALNEEKLPIYFDILEGNSQDKQTVIPLIKKLQRKFSLTQSIFVGDRGMVTVENLQFLEREEIDYIIALTHRKARELILEKDVQPELFDEKVPITIYSEEKKKYVLCGSKYRKEHDQTLLHHLLEKGKKALETVAKMVETGRLKDSTKVIRRAQEKLTKAGCKNFYDFKYEDGKFRIIEKTSFIQKAKTLCGYYILETTKLEMADKQVESHYKQLKFVEDSFRQLKDLIEIRPIFHWKERRVKTHIFLCIIAQTVVNKIKDALKQAGWLKEEKTNSFSHFLDIFSQVDLGMFEIEKARKEIASELSEEAKRLLEIFKIEKEYFVNIEKVKEECHRLQ